MRFRLLALIPFLVLWLIPAAAFAAPSADHAIPGGWFYSEANGHGGGPDQPGYAVTDEDGVPMYAQFVAGGGVATFGYPASPRLTFDGFTDQVFQKSVFQWSGTSVQYLNVMDALHAAGKDAWLQTTYQTPPPMDTAADTGLPFDQVVARHQALLDGNPALKAAYFASPDPLALYGLPLTQPTPELNGQVVVVRLQRAVLQQWLVSMPWAPAGDVTVANAGDIFKASGLLPAAVVAPQPAPFVAGPAQGLIAGAAPAQVPSVAQVPASPVAISGALLTTADLPAGFFKDATLTEVLSQTEMDVFIQRDTSKQLTGPVLILDLGTVADSPAQAQESITRVTSELPAQYAGIQYQPVTPAPTIGQKAIAYRATASYQGVKVNEYLVVFAEGKDIILVAAGGVAGSVTPDYVAGLARTIDSRITGA